MFGVRMSRLPVQPNESDRWSSVRMKMKLGRPRGSAASRVAGTDVRQPAKQRSAKKQSTRNIVLEQSRRRGRISTQVNLFWRLSLPFGFDRGQVGVVPKSLSQQTFSQSTLS